jgi:glycosyltransferase involved in cell wall biosynthesis
MKICHIVPIYLPGILPGCSKYIQDISEILSKRDHQVTLLTADALTGRGWVDPIFGKYASVKEERINGVRVKRLKTRWEITSISHLLKKIPGNFFPSSMKNWVSLLSAGPYLSDMKKELEKEKDGIIHVTAFPFSLMWQVWKVCQELSKPFVCTPLIHFEDPNHKNSLLWKTLMDASSVIACSNFEKNKMTEFGVHPSKIHLIPMGINLAEWGNPDGERFRRKYRLHGKKMVLFAGTKGYNKGAISLLQAVEEIRHKIKEVMLVSIGLSTEEWYREKNLLSEDHHLDLGYIAEEEKRDAFDACDLFVMPSRYDSFGIVYLEAWQCGKPVIGAKVGAIPEIIEDGGDGLLVEFGRTDQLASAILHLLNHPDLRKEMGEKGGKKVIERFNWQKNVEKLETILTGAKAE